MLHKRTYLIAGAGVVILLVIAAVFLMTRPPAKQHAAAGDPVDIAHDFYDSWLKAALSTSTNPYKEGLAKSPLLSAALQSKIADAQKTKGALDPVLCQDAPPVTLATRLVYKTDAATQLVVTASHSNSTQEAIVDMTALDGGWYINDIQCSAGEVAPVKEFTFDTEGSLLKSSVKPLDGKHWYLIFTQDGEAGHYVPLLFNDQSTCIGVDGSSSVCKPDTFVQTARAHVQGDMTETGAIVKKLQFLQ